MVGKVTATDKQRMVPPWAGSEGGDLLQAFLQAVCSYCVYHQRFYLDSQVSL